MTALAEAAALLQRVTLEGMGGTPDLFGPDCPDHGNRCPDGPWECWNDAAHAWLAASKWQGPPCGMCAGTGVCRMVPGDGVAYPLHCAACNGYGREAS